MPHPYPSLGRQLLKYKWRYIAGILALFVTDALQQVVPKVTGSFTDDLALQRLTPSGIWRYVGIILGTAAIIAISRYTWRVFVFGTARLVEQDMRSDLFRHLLRLSPSFYHRHKTGDLMAVATNDIQAVRGIAGEGVLMSADAIMMVVLTLGSMISDVGVKLSALALMPLPILAISASYFGKLIFTRSRLVQDAFGWLSDVTQENISGVRVVKAFAQEEHEEAKFDEANRNYLKRFMSMMRIHSLVEPSISLLAGLCFVLALLFPGRAVLRGEIGLGSFVSLTMYIGMLIWPMLAMGWVVNIIQRGMAGFERLKQILDEEPEVTNVESPVMPKDGTIHGEIEIRNLSFHYPSQQVPALHGVSVSLNPGETLGIFGRTGSGKSTIAALLVRMFNPPRGTIFIDGVDILDLPLDLLRRSIAYVPQESFLFSRTVGQNIGYAPGDWPSEAIRHAARTAQVEQDILDFLPEGYETMVGERGVTLSGGQRQRVGLSRAVLKEAPILLLDDCLSAVDTSTEARILGGLRPVMQERTTVVISHRVSAVKNADKIIVLENGRIVESGTHEELIARSGYYARSYQRQQLEEAIEATE